MSNDKISNIIGTRLPQWVFNQLRTRSEQNSKSTRDNNNLLYLANKSSWVRLVSSVNISQNDIDYFKNTGINLKDKTSLAKEFVLFGGTSKYLNKQSYQLRKGFNETYSILGKSETQKYGYRPMPGITNVDIQTQGRLGSIRMATINFKCWDKMQLDIMDALYFKLGFTMFLEWGHTFFYPSENKSVNGITLDPNKVSSTEFFSLDPFEKGLTKEEIFRRISINNRQSEGNYDAMLGIVTNFNFSFNQEGGYDCTIKIISLGVLGDNIKVNQPNAFQNVLKEEIQQYINTLDEIAKAKKAEEDKKNQLVVETQQKRIQNIVYLLQNQDRNGVITAGKNKGTTYKSVKELYAITDEEEKEARKFVSEKGSVKNLTAEQLISQYLEFDKQKNRYEFKNTDNPVSVSYPSDVKATPENANLSFEQVLLIRKLKGLVPSTITDDKNVFIKINTKRLTEILDINPANANNSNNLKSIITDKENWDIPNAVNRALSVSSGETEIFRRAYKGWSNDFNYIFYVRRKSYAETKDKNVAENSKSIIIDQKEFVDEFIKYTQSEKFSGFLKLGATPKTLVENYPQYLDLTGKKILRTYSGQVFTLQFSIPIKKRGLVTVKNTGISGDTTTVTTESRELEYEILVTFEFSDTSLISDIKTDIDQPIDFISYEEQLKAQDKGNQPEEPPLPPQSTSTEQTDSPIYYRSSLEYALRIIQVHSLSKAISKTGDVGIDRSTQVIQLWKQENQTTERPPFINQIFSNGIFSPFITELISGEIEDKEYDKISNQNPKDRLKVHAKYGFATNLMANKSPLYDQTGNRNFSPVDYKKLLNSYVIPYEINQEIEGGTPLNHPVYIPLGQFLMLLNHNCIIYDTKNSDCVTPLVYVDYNPNHNFCLSNSKQLSTDPFTCIIPFNGNSADFKNLINSDVVIQSQKDGNFYIYPVSGSTDLTPLFRPDSGDQILGDNLSGDLLEYKYQTSGTDTYNPNRGVLMNILLNIDYLLQVVKDFSAQDGENKVYLKPLIEQVLTGINKSLGNINMLRVSYNDPANVFQIVDDQIVPSISGETQLVRSDLSSELPLFGLKSIARNLEIKTEMSSKLSNMLAVSANANVESKASLSEQGDLVGYINFGYEDRYLPNREKVNSKELRRSKLKEILNDPSKTEEEKTREKLLALQTDLLDSEKNAAIQFNSAIKSFYNSINPAKDQIGFATNYYIDRMNNVKGNEASTRASAIIPVSLNFTTDGISGLNMYQAFTVSDELLPYTYKGRKNIDGTSDVNKVGFVVVGLNHTIQDNIWQTSVRSNMIFLKDTSDYKEEKLLEKKSGKLLAIDTPGTLDYPSDIKTSYPQLPLLEPPDQDVISYDNVKKKLKALTDEKTAKIVFGIMWAEAAKTNNKQFKSAGGFNYTGIQTDSGKWGGLDNLIVARFIRKDAVRLREFAQFRSNEDFFKFMIEKVKAKKFTSDSAELWAERYLNSWVYLDLISKDRKQYDNLFPSKVSIYKTAINQYNNLA